MTAAQQPIDSLAELVEKGGVSVEAALFKAIDKETLGAGLRWRGLIAI